MTDLRDERAAVLTRWHRDLGDNFKAVLPRVLDDLDAIDRGAMASWRFKVGGTIYEAADVTIYASGSVVVYAGSAGQSQAAPEPTAPTDEQIAAPAKPATRRRTAR